MSSSSTASTKLLWRTQTYHKPRATIYSVLQILVLQLNSAHSLVVSDIHCPFLQCNTALTVKRLKKNPANPKPQLESQLYESFHGCREPPDKQKTIPVGSKVVLTENIGLNLKVLLRDWQQEYQISGTSLCSWQTDVLLPAKDKSFIVLEAYLESFMRCSTSQIPSAGKWELCPGTEDKRQVLHFVAEGIIPA